VVNVVKGVVKVVKGGEWDLVKGGECGEWWSVKVVNQW
jgi:hypothetical protein